MVKETYAMTFGSVTLKQNCNYKFNLLPNTFDFQNEFDCTVTYCGHHQSAVVPNESIINRTNENSNEDSK